jgi:hypothetical protein
MINAPQLLADLKRRLIGLEDDLRARISTLPDLKASLSNEWQAARDANRTAETLESWSDQVITQAGVHWLLSCVFLRFIEDNTLVDRPWIGGTPDSGRLLLAKDRHEAYFREHPLESDREYLLSCFTEAGTLPGLHTFFDQAHNPVFRLGISGDAAMGLRQFWQQQDPNTGALLHDFTDATWNTRFLGDLYQDLSEATRKRYALLQTPEFVEEFILDRTLTPAIREFGYQVVKMIDPTCGSGHFLLGGFSRMVDEWSRAEPNRNRRDVAQKALDAVSGVDLNPFAVAISRFRLLVAALQASDVHRLSEAPDFKINVAIGDSLLHGKRFGLTFTEDMFQNVEHFTDTGLAHVYADEDLTEVQRILGRQYHAVVGNPPYIVVKDPVLSAAYRTRYASCHRQYSLGVPFTERFFDLAQTSNEHIAGGFIGLITANSFMKREFGSKLIEEFFPRVDLTHVIDTAGAYIPGHGTPTVVLFGRNRRPVSTSIRAVMGIKGEPSSPVDPSAGLVWTSIRNYVDRPGELNEFVSTEDVERKVLATHPWALGGSGVIALLQKILENTSRRLTDLQPKIGAVALTRFDDAYVLDAPTIRRMGLTQARSRQYVAGEDVRDWCVQTQFEAIWPYEQDGGRLVATLPVQKVLWPFRSQLLCRVAFGKTQTERGLPWYEYSMLFQKRFNAEIAVSFSNVATHNHFSVVTGGRIFNAHAPLLILGADCSLEDYVGLAGLLNSSLACLWMKQTFHNKGSTVDSKGARQRTDAFEDFYEFTGTGLVDFPVPNDLPKDTAGRQTALALEWSATTPEAIIRELPKTFQSFKPAQTLHAIQHRKMIALQEEIDWQCYHLYGLIDFALDVEDPPEVELGQRAFEIALARRMIAGTEQTSWFKRHGSVPITEVPLHWPERYRHVVQQRIELIETGKIQGQDVANLNIALIERPEYKRRWNSPQWIDMEQAALRSWLLARLELPIYWPTSADQPPQLTSTSRLADAARLDADFMQMAELYAGHADFDPSQLVAQLVVSESVPFLPSLRYTEAGLRKRTQWEDTWAMQRREDAGEAVGNIPVPPKYKSTDFLKTDVWRLRGGLDVPKERWISYPGCERGADGSLVIAWAGWDHLKQATAIASYYLDMKDSEGWPPERLQPLLAGLLELVPWLEQWHNEVDPVYGERMGHYYKGFVSEEARAQGFTLDDLKAWKPAVAATHRGRRRAAA